MSFDSDLPPNVVLVRIIFEEEYFLGGAYEVTEDEWSKLIVSAVQRKDGAYEGRTVNSRLLDMITDREDVGPLYTSGDVIAIERCVSFIDLNRNVY